MIRFLFWNQKRRELSKLLEDAARNLDLDIIATCETTGDHIPTSIALTRVGRYEFCTGFGYERFQIFTSFDRDFIKILDEEDRFVILLLSLPGRDPFLLMVLHAPGKKAGWNDESLAIELSNYADQLRSRMVDFKIDLAVVMGDFNCNPFSSGLIGAKCFNASMEMSGNKKSRRVQGRDYANFYNPMWNLLGDKTPSPPGSLYYDSSTQTDLRWHLIDQVIVSKSMAKYLDVSKIRLLDTIGEVSLVTKNGRPKGDTYSDHLPLYFELNL